MVKSIIAGVLANLSCEFAAWNVEHVSEVSRVEAIKSHLPLECLSTLRSHFHFCLREISLHAGQLHSPANSRFRDVRFNAFLALKLTFMV